MEDFDLIVPSSTYPDPDGTLKYDHTRDVILAADEEATGDGRSTPTTRR